MIIARSPLRITLGGGGTDLPSYYERFGGFLIAAAVDRYVYITLHDTFMPHMLVKYSELERVDNASELKHPILREAFALLGMDGHSLELTSMADIPAGTGLGSSGSFTTALLKALHAHKRSLVHPAELAAQACEVELGRLKEPIGKQDQYIAAYGGITCFKFLQNGNVEAWPLKLSRETRDNLEDNLLLFFTGFSRSASAILKEQDQKSKSDDKSMIENLHFVKDLGLKSQAALEGDNLPEFARLMDVHWQHKKQRSGGMSNPKINEWYELAMANGALGGKLIGAGGGGFLMFYTEDKVKLRHVLTRAGLREVRFRFDFEGTKLVIS
jgi:D-glycero-alpha-D-manno-heptose-7-phosphate kinase